MDILLAHGYFLYDDPHERAVMRPYAPLGILQLSSYMKSKGFTVGVFDSTFESMSAFESLVLRERPTTVGLYSNLMTKFNVLKMIAFCRAQGIHVVVGGPDPPYYAAEYIEHGADVVVRGEGELTLEELLPHLARYGPRNMNKIAGITYRRDDGEIVETLAREFVKNLSDLPWADREAIEIPQYMRVWKEHHGQSSISVIHARGCVYTCTWCSHSVYGFSHRRRTVEDAADELLWLKETYNPDLIWYADDVFAINHRWLYRYQAALKERGVKIPFECISRADRLNEEVITALADMGCYRLWNGSESGSQRILDAMQRKVQVEDVQAKTHLLQKHGIETGMFIMLGYDGETIADLEATTEHLKISNPDIFLTTVAYPIKGTPYFAEVESRILANAGWTERNDRDLTVAGRHSRRFYNFATRWMVNEVALHKAQQSDATPFKRKLKLWANTRIGRLGMALTKGQSENDGHAVHAGGPSLMG